MTTKPVEYLQAIGDFESTLVYLHANGEYEGFYSKGETEEEARNNCIERIKDKLRMIGMPFNQKRITSLSEIEDSISNFEKTLIEDDFLYSQRGSKN